MRSGQADLISTVIMVGVVLVIGIAALSYFNSSVSAQRAEMQLHSLLAVESSRTVTSIVYGNGTDYVIFLSKKMTPAYLDIVVLGATTDSPIYSYLAMGEDYEVYVGEVGEPRYEIDSLDGWDPVSQIIKSARQVYVRDQEGASPYMRLSEFCNGLPAGGAVTLGRLFVEANEPVLLRIRLKPGLSIDTAWVMILLEVSGSSYQIVAVPLPYHD